MKQLLSSWESIQNTDAVDIKKLTAQRLVQHIEEILVIASKFGFGTFHTIKNYDNDFSLTPADRDDLCNFLKIFASKKQTVLNGVGSAEIWMDAGGIAENLGLIPEAESFYRLAIHYDEKNVKAWSSLGYILESRGNYSGATKAYEQAYALERDEELLWDKLVPPRELRDTLEEASKTYEDTFGVGADGGMTWLAVGISKQAQKDCAGAIKAFEKGLSENPKNPKLWYNLGLAYETQSDVHTAESAYKKALQNDPRNAEAWNALGFILRKVGNFSGALYCWEQAISLGDEKWEKEVIKLQVQGIKPCQIQI